MLLRRLARPMLAAIFIQGGIAALRNPQDHVRAAKPVLDAVTPVVEKAADAAAPAVDKAAQSAPIDLPRTATSDWLDDETLVKVDAGVKIVAGSMLALGKAPRLASTALAASLIPTTLATHRFWEETDKQARYTEQVEFLKHLGLLGGLLLAAADTEGKPSLAWRGRKAAQLAAAAAATQVGNVTDAVDDVTDRVSDAAHDATGRVAGLAAGAAGLLPAAAASKRGSKTSRLARNVVKSASKATSRAQRQGADLQKAAEKRAAELQKAVDKRGNRMQDSGSGFLEQLTTQATKLGQDVAARASTVGAEVAQQAEGVAKDTRKRVGVLSR
jgi:uncharacterized membrane protein YphA (DoxX/SURF4 family)